MVEYIELYKMKLKVKDIFNMNDLIKNMSEWCKENYYQDEDGVGIDDNPQETVYTHAIRSGGNVLDAWIWWRIFRYPFGTTKDDAYVRYRINIDMHFLGDPRETDVMQKGKKVGVNKMEVEIEMLPVLEIDFRNDFKKSNFLTMINDVLRKKLYKKEMDDHIAALYTDAYRMHAMLKQYFNLEAMMPEETVSQPPKGLMP